MGAWLKKKPAMGWLVVALALGMLIWVRLRLVTDIPRSAYAEPEKRSEPAGNAVDDMGTRGAADGQVAEPERIASGEEL